MPSLSASTLALILVPLGACGGAATPPPERVATTGAVSEDEFVRLHQLTEAEAPALRGETIDLGGSTAYLSLPEGAPPRAGVLVIHEWWGLNDHIRHWADRLAAEGYAALAIDLYGGRVATTPEEAMALMRTVDEEAGVAIVRRGAQLLAEDPRVRAPRRAVIGWCFGGAWSLETALRVEGLDATVMYYGRTVEDPERLRALGGPLLGIFGNLDTSIPPERVDAFDAALTEAGVTHEILRFDAPHAFANPSNAHYDHESAEAAWERTRAFLREHLR
ncbi:MAG: dienelactone hydrolase family protein [Sandaracinaceae bacterium]|nr:dienelactone hydrolase family protein [Sandaracinaceae bacterium]